MKIFRSLPSIIAATQVNVALKVILPRRLFSGSSVGVLKTSAMQNNLQIDHTLAVSAPENLMAVCFRYVTETLTAATRTKRQRKTKR